jgi:hypothetical protein
MNDSPVWTYTEKGFKFAVGVGVYWIVDAAINTYVTPLNIIAKFILWVTKAVLAGVIKNVTDTYLTTLFWQFRNSIVTTA